MSVVHDFADLPILLAGEEKKKKPQAGNPIVPGSELPNEDYDENAENEFRGDEQRRRDDKPKDNPCI